MTHQFSCVVDGCDFRAEGESEEEVLEQVREHAEENHPDVDVDEQEVRNGIQQV